MRIPEWSDQSHMRDYYGSTEWTLKLAALSEDEPLRLMRFLTGVLLSCGGWVLSRSAVGSEMAEIDFEFARSSCIEVYAALVSAGLELSRESHQQMAEFCQCSNMVHGKGYDVARIDLVIYSDRNLQSHFREEALMHV